MIEKEEYTHYILVMVVVLAGLEAAAVEAAGVVRVSLRVEVGALQLGVVAHLVARGVARAPLRRLLGPRKVHYNNIVIVSLLDQIDRVSKSLKTETTFSKLRSG